MAKIEKFEDIQAWQKARELTARIYALTRDGPVFKDYGYRNQLTRASTSIMLNIAEGFERETGDKDFRYFLSVAKGSAGEVRAALYVGLDCGYFTKEQFDELFQLSIETIRMLSRFITYLSTPR
jgi:four helix bundle protein